MTTAPKAKNTTGIGSLPHHNMDAALAYSFRMGIPFLPQIPIRNPWEYMIAQALEGLPGLQADPDGSVTLNTDLWVARTAEFSKRLDAAFRSDESLERFEPAPSLSSCWQPFVWELEESGARIAKIQIAGPMTAQWALKLKDSQGHPIAPQAFTERNPELSTQIFRLVLARALAMCKRLKRVGIQPLLFLDEPGLYAFSPSQPRHVLALQELKLLIQALAKESVQVGLHCCGDTDWKAVLALPIHYLSFDTHLSAASLFKHAGPGQALREFIARGGRLSFGIVPTKSDAEPAGEPRGAPRDSLYGELLRELRRHWHDQPALVQKVLSEALYTPACGLALNTVAEAEHVLDSLQEVARGAHAGH